MNETDFLSLILQVVNFCLLCLLFHFNKEQKETQLKLNKLALEIFVLIDKKLDELEQGDK